MYSVLAPLQYCLYAVRHDHVAKVSRIGTTSHTASKVLLLRVMARLFVVTSLLMVTMIPSPCSLGWFLGAGPGRQG
jgi:hypothetical protein